MYHQHWGLRESPFRNRLDVRAFHASPAHEEALARLHFLADQRRRVGLLLAGAGCGKSLLLEVFGTELRREGKEVVRLGLMGLGTREFLWQLAAAFGLTPRESETDLALWRKAVDHLAENRYQRRDTVLLLDDADEAEAAVLAHVARLAQSDPTAENRLTLVLAGDPMRLDQFGPRLLDLAELRIELQPWEQGDTFEYVAAALKRAGRNRSVFSDEALVQLHELSHGVPRRINQFADLALLAGAGQGLDQIDADTVRTVRAELSVGQAAFVPVLHG
jgi:general secretion pathway protein A